MRNEVMEKKINEIKAKLHQQSSTQITSTTNDEISLLNLLTTRYRRPLFIGILSIFTGSLLLYKYVFINDRNQ